MADESTTFTRKPPGETVAAKLCIEYLTAPSPEAELKAYYALRKICLRACQDLYIPKPHDNIIETAVLPDDMDVARKEQIISNARRRGARTALAEAIDIALLEFLFPYRGKSADELRQLGSKGVFDPIGNRVRSRIISVIRHRNSAKYRGETISLNQSVGTDEEGNEHTLGQELGILD